MKVKGLRTVRHSPSVNAILCLWLLSATYVMAEEPADRTAIERTIAGLNELPRRATLFTDEANASAELARLPKVPRRLKPHGDPPKPTVTISHEPWGEATIDFPAMANPTMDIVNPRIAGGPVTFITPESALVDGTWTYNDGSMLQTIPMFFVMKKEGADWKIASLRVVAPR